MNKGLVTGMICVAALSVGYAQPPVAIWTQKFDAYQTMLPGTKLELVFNQEKYSPGDTAWFKAYFLSDNLRGIPGKQLINLDLVDTKGMSSGHLLFAVNDGIGYNQFVIPDTLSGGIYVVSAYNNWMRNFDPPQFFKKELTIVRENRVVRKENDISVVAEGGHLIAGIPNKVIIRARPRSAVKVTEPSGMEVIQTVTGNDGLAVAMLTPSFQDYAIQYVGESGRFPLPVVEKDGIGLRITPGRGNGGPLQIVITSPPASDYRKDEIAIFVSSRGKIHYSTTFTQQTSDSVSFIIPGKDLPQGITHVSLLSPSGKVLASRDFYSPGIHAVQADIKMRDTTVEPRGEVSMEISLTDDDGLPVMGEFSVDVLNADLFGDDSTRPLSNDAAIFAGFPGGPAVDSPDTTWLTRLDNHLITRNIAVPWQNILTSASIHPAYNFTNVIQKRGRAYLGDTGSAVPDQTSIMFYLQGDKVPYEVTTSSGGQFTLSIFDLYGRDELFYMAQAGRKDIPNIKIEWTDERIALPHAPASVETPVMDPYARFTFRRRLINQSYSVYNASAAIVASSRKQDEYDIEDVIKGADVSVNVQDYIKFPTMEELVKEVIPALYRRKRGDREIIRVKYLNPVVAPGEPPFVPGSPIFIIDGIVTRNTDFFLSLVPADLLTVKIIYDPRKLARFGMMGKNGIVIVQTKSGDVREPLSDRTRLVEGLNVPLTFSKSENVADQRMSRPDFRSTVYWNPVVKTDSKGKATIRFFCTDDVGILNLHIQGLSADGMPFSVGQKLEVRVAADRN